MEVLVTSFCFINAAGGTGIAKGSRFTEEFPRPAARVKIRNGFHDYETGWRFIGEAADPELTAYIEAHASKEDRRVFVSEFELADLRDLGPLIDFVEGIATDPD